MTSDSKQPSGQQDPSQADEHGAAAARSGGSGRDALGIALLVVSFFIGAAVVMAYVDPKDEASGVTGMVMALVDTLGISAMFLSLGLCWIGIRLFMRGVDGKLARDLGGVVLTTFTLAVLVGALSPELGGSVGDLGAMVTRQMSAQVGVVLGTAIGALFGLIVVLLPAWGLWIRPAAIAAGELPRTSAPLAPRASDSSGVSQAEAEGLLPKAPVRAPLSPAQLAGPAASPSKTKDSVSAGAPAEKVSREKPTPDNTKLSPSKVVAPSPYPPDVRREGRVPEGARPLGAGPLPSEPATARPEVPQAIPQARPAPSPSAAAAPAHEPSHEPLSAEVPRDAAAVRARDGVAAEVQPGDVRPVGRATDVHGGVPAPVVDVRAGQRGSAQQPVAGSASAAASGHAALAGLSAAASAGAAAGANSDARSGATAPIAEREAPDEPETFADTVARAGAYAEPTVTPLDRTPPKPSWEQSDLFEEPVDAYGTPLSLVEALRHADEEGEQAPAEEPEAAESVAAEVEPSWGDQPLDDEVFEETVKPIAVAEAAPPMASEGDTEVDEELEPEFEAQASRVEETPIAAEPASEKDAESVSSSDSQVADERGDDGEASRDDLRAELRGFIDLRGSRPTEVRAPESEESAASEGSIGEVRVRSSVESVVEAPDEAPVEALAPSVRAENAADEHAAEERPNEAGSNDTVSNEVASHESSSSQAAAVESASKHASAKPAVVIRSLFGEEEPAPSASAATSASAPEVVADAPREDIAAESATDSATDSGAASGGDSGAAEVVLEPARKPKRKSKSAARGEALAASSAATGDSAESAAQADETVAASSAGSVDAASPSEDPSAASSEPQARELEVEPDRDTGGEPGDEPHVELTPAKPRGRSRLTVDEVVFKAGCLFVERQRVAVSMLQREFGLDFDAATSVLDQLQRAGLIGPYLGGQRRDILMTMDEWQELVAVE